MGAQGAEKDFYAVLGLTKSATVAQINDAFVSCPLKPPRTVRTLVVNGSP